MSTDRNMIIDSDKFQDIIDKFDKKIGEVEETLYNISKTMQKIDGNNDIWKSKVAETVYDKFYKLSKNFEKINAELTVYSIFLQETQEEYVEEEKKQETAIENYSEELSIN